MLKSTDPTVGETWSISRIRVLSPLTLTRRLPPRLSFYPRWNITKMSEPESKRAHEEGREHSEKLTDEAFLERCGHPTKDLRGMFAKKYLAVPLKEYQVFASPPAQPRIWSTLASSSHRSLTTQTTTL